MIASLKGTVTGIIGNRCILDVNGVGYEVICTAQLLHQLAFEEAASVTVYTDVREDQIQLFGFSDQLEKQVFLLLIKVKGVGTKSACEIVSRLETRELLRVIGAGDLAALQRVKGVGKKTAERIIVELKDRVGEFVQESGAMGRDLQPVLGQVSMPVEEATEALCALGFARAEAERAVAKVTDAAIGRSASEIVKEALRYV